MSALTTKLKTLLGTESADSWLVFMDEIALNMPFLFEVGRPSAEQIADSEIGEAGFSSWKNYVEKGLGWKMSAWEAWRRAYKTVQDHSYLRDLEPTVSAINKTSADGGKDAFPANVDAWKSGQKEVVRKAADAKALSLAAAQKRVIELEAVMSAKDEVIAGMKVTYTHDVAVLNDLVLLKENALAQVTTARVLEMTKIDELNARLNDQIKLTEELQSYKDLPWYKKIF